MTDLSSPGYVTLPQRKRHVRVVLKGGTMFYDMDCLPDFSMPAFILSCRGAGYILNNEMYTPMDQVQTIYLWSDDKPPKPGEGIVVEFPGKPA